MKNLTAIFFIPAVLAVGACGEIRVEDVKVTHSIDVKSLEQYFKASCIAEHPTYNSTQVTTCSQELVGELLSELVGD